MATGHRYSPLYQAISKGSITFELSLAKMSVSDLDRFLDLPKQSAFSISSSIISDINYVMPECETLCEALLPLPKPVISISSVYCAQT